MKHFTKLLVATLLVACTICAASAFHASAAETVNVTIPEFGILINGDEVSNSYAKYPCIVYKDITYFPMTYNDSRALGLVADWTVEEGLVISKTEGTPCAPDFEQGDRNIGGTATVATGKITVNGKAIDNSAEEYPILLFRDITYFPLTWRFAVEEFGWQYNFTNKNGLVISCGNTPAKGKLVVYTNAEFAPFEYIVNGKIIGVDIDICQRIADEMGVELEIVNMDFDSVIAAIAAGKGDIGASGFTITEERQIYVDFSIPYYTTSQYIVVPKGSAIHSVDDLAGKKVAVQIGTMGDLAVTDMNTNGIAITRLNNINEGCLGIGTEYDAIVCDESNAKNFSAVFGFDTILIESIETDRYGLVINKNSTDILEVANKVIADMINDGSIARSFDFHSNLSAIPY